MVRHDRAILAIDLADGKQALVVGDHDSRVLARRSVRGHAWQLEEALGWGRQVAASTACRHRGGLRADRAPLADRR